MSLRAMVWALEDADVTDRTALLVLVALAERAGDDGQGAWPSVAWLAKRARCSDRTVQRALTYLLEVGLIRRGDQRSVAHIRADRRPTVYDVAVPWAAFQAPVEEPEQGSLLEDEEVVAAAPARGDEVSREAPRGDTGVVHGVSPVSPKPSYEPSKNQPPHTPPRSRSADDGPGVPFEDFWMAYPAECPRRREKGWCAKKWASLTPEQQRLAMQVLSRDRLTIDWRKNRGQFIPAPRTWLGRSPWEDAVEAEAERRARLREEIRNRGAQ